MKRATLLFVLVLSILAGWHFYSKKNKKLSFSEGGTIASVTLSIASYQVDKDAVRFDYKVDNDVRWVVTTISGLQTAQGKEYQPNDVYLIQFDPNSHFALPLRQILPPFPEIPDEGWESSVEFYTDYQESK